MTARAYYNEIDPYAAEWLRNLIVLGHIAPGDVDERSIHDVRPSDLAGYTQCHFFAGIGVWSYALRRAGWPDDRPVWTGSCPCQPFSSAGLSRGFNDERHLWPYWDALIDECQPATIFGEQVASKDADPWLDLVQTDLEAMGYAFGAVPFPAAGIGAPHIRERLYWVADADSGGSPAQPGDAGEMRGIPKAQREPELGTALLGRSGGAGRLGHADVARPQGLGSGYQAEGGRVGAFRPVAETGESCGLADADGGHASAERQQCCGQQRQQPEDGGAGGLADMRRAGPLGRRECENSLEENQRRQATERSPDTFGLAGLGAPGDPGPTNGHWRAADWLLCRDGKWRPVEPGAFPLAYGATARVGRLRAYGNAIVAQAAEEFIRARLDYDYFKAEALA